MAESTKYQFMQLTGADDSVADAFLEQTRGNLEAAVSLFFDTDGPAVGARAPAPAPAAAPRRSAARVYDDDEWEAAPTSDDVRAPLQSRVEQLSAPLGVPPVARFAPSGHAMRTAPQPTVHRAFRNFREERADMSKAASSSSRNLAALLRPPTELLFPGTFDEAREAARAQRKWLLVNIQVDEEFDCWRLNRDTWKYDAVADMIRASFVFWQQQWDFDTSAASSSSSSSRRGADVVVKAVNPHARDFMTRYQLPHDFPVILIIDPRTREKVHTHTGFWSPTDFMAAVTEFITAHSFDSEDAIPAKRTWDPRFKSSAAAVVPAARAAVPEPVDEDAALAAAIAASLAGPQEAAVAVDDDGEHDEHDDDGDDDGAEFMYDDDVDYSGLVDNGSAAASPGATAAATSTAATRKRSRDDVAQQPALPSITAAVEGGRKRGRTPGAPRAICRALLPEVDPSTTATADTARVQLRLPDGTRLQRPFAADAPIAQLFYVVSCVLHAPHAVTTRMVAAIEAAARQAGDVTHLNELTRDNFLRAVQAVTSADVSSVPSVDPVVSVVDADGAVPERSFDIKRPFPAASITPDALAGKTFREAGLTSAMLHVSWES